MSRTHNTIGGSSEVTVRTADPHDGVILARLATLDSAPMPVGPTLLAEIDGEAVAAFPLAGGAPVADPFRRTAAAIELLELRAAQIRGDRTSTGPASAGVRLRALIRVPRALSPR